MSVHTAFQQIDQGIDAQQYALTWVSHLLVTQGHRLTEDDRRDLWLTMQRLTGYPQAVYTLQTFHALLQTQQLKDLLAPFCDE